MFPLLVLFGRIPGWSKERVSGSGTGILERRRIRQKKQQVSEGEGVPDKVLWVQQSATTGWAEVSFWVEVIYLPTPSELPLS